MSEDASQEAVDSLADRRDNCPRLDAHDAHMRMNGACPWCAAVDPSRIDPNFDVDHPEG